MSIKFSVGVAEGERDWELLEQCRFAPAVVAIDDDFDTRPPGWPRPEERSDDESDHGRPLWAW